MMPSFPHAVAAPSIGVLGERGKRHGQGTKAQQSRTEKAENRQEEAGRRRHPIEHHDRGAEEVIPGRRRRQSLVFASVLRAESDGGMLIAGVLADLARLPE